LQFEIRLSCSFAALFFVTDFASAFRLVHDGSGRLAASEATHVAVKGRAVVKQDRSLARAGYQTNFAYRMDFHAASYFVEVRPEKSCRVSAGGWP
jgi:hypothetical protein